MLLIENFTQIVHKYIKVTKFSTVPEIIGKIAKIKKFTVKFSLNRSYFDLTNTFIGGLKLSNITKPLSIDKKSIVLYFQNKNIATIFQDIAKNYEK